MPGLLPNIDPDGLLEFSVVYTDRALNHMSKRFQGVMKDISSILKEVYHAQAAVLVPGSGTFGMEAVARQFATGKKALVIRNGWFSYRWTQIFDMGQYSVGVDRAQGTPRWRRPAGALDSLPGGRGGGHHPRQQARRGVCPACGNRRRHDPARRLPESGGGRGA